MSDTKSPYDDEVTDPYAAEDTKSPHEAEGDPPADDSDNDGEAAPLRKRGPGRPRKSAS